MTPPDPDVPIDLSPATEHMLASSSVLGTYWPTVICLVLAAAFVTWWWWRRRRRPTTPIATFTTWGSAVVLGLLAAVLALNTWTGYVPTMGAARTLAEFLWGAHSAPAPVAAPSPPAGSAGPRADSGPSTGTVATPGHRVTPDHRATPGHRVTLGHRVTTASTGGIITATVPSTAHGVPDRPVRFYLPPGYDAPGNTARYPVYYLLHGSPGTGGDWSGGGQVATVMDALIAAREVPPAIVAMPDLTTGTPTGQESVDYPDGGPQFETFFQDDVVPTTDATLRTIADRGHRVVGGMSSGGLESLTFALHRPETFGAAISIMAYRGPVGADLRTDPGTMAAYSPVALIDTAPFAQPLAVYLAQGDQEPEADNRAIKAALRTRGQAVTLQIFPGKRHNWTMARAAEPYGLVWAARQLGWR